MKEEILDAYSRKSLAGGVLAIAGWGGLILSTIWISEWFSFSNSRVQMIGILMNSLLTLGLLLVYMAMARDTATQAKFQEQQTRLMELERKPVLNLEKISFDGEEAVYQATNNGPGMGLDLTLEIERQDIDESYRSLARSPDENPESSPSVLRPGDSTKVAFTLRVPTESGPPISVQEFHEKLVDENRSQIVYLRAHIKFGTEREHSPLQLQAKLGDGTTPDDFARSHISIDPD